MRTEPAMRATVLCMAALALAAPSVSSGEARADRSSPVADSCPEAPEARYFPVGRLRPGKPASFLPDADLLDADLFVRQWFSRHLAAMEEPSLSCGPLEAIEAYRFLWLRTFHNPVAVRIFRRSDNYGLEAVILDGKGGYRPGLVSHRVTKELSRDQWRAVIVKLDE